jgi:DNA-binding transcriptional MerR regulator
VEKALPPIPAKRYFTIGEVSELCGVKPYVLRYWEQEFTQLRPMKRRGNRRYYQHHEVLLVRRIRELLYDQGFTISGARNRLGDTAGRAARARGTETLPPLPQDEAGLAVRPEEPEAPDPADAAAAGEDEADAGFDAAAAEPAPPQGPGGVPAPAAATLTSTPQAPAWNPSALRRELLALRELLSE